MPQRFFIETFGCQMNEHDSEKVAGLLAHRGMVAVNSLEEADLFLINTCSVREKAAQKLYSRLGEVKKHKTSHPQFLIGVLGCLAQQEGEDMVKRVPFVDLVVGTHMFHALPDLLEEVEQRRGSGARVATDFLPAPTPVEIPQVIRQSDFRANITIMEGCNKQCSFCIVPTTRGRERNRPAQAVLQEARRAVDQGYVEILLLGQTVNSYKDPNDRHFRFADLLSQVASIPRLQRVRFTSPHPREFDDHTISVIGEMETICNQVHLPLQSGSTPILKRMRRQYTRERYLEIVDKFRNCGRPIALSTDIIVGFPGESDADFQQTLSLVEEVQFESMFSFKYSPRPHTAAEHWQDEIPEEKKTHRLMLLQKMQKEIQLRLHQEHYLGRHLEVLVEGTARDGVRRFGRTSTNKVVNFPGTDRPGTFTEVFITDVGPNSLVGQKTTDRQQNCA
ncbi:MAG: tRNA (N6-isopentenyl adenosine(37)-C2)-methylthiotransferase MiaB [Acidobacteria bacterium]|nr:tRNA (N6-isopentenyl adenosine(37)-C2)-methylthiotransferase MiaB [Acidobacteriota bacterium]MCZ6768417.1 tRNA (N6-isopentenyl adenosine(37)-C2)-methylthiotransferase MiaB [Acidobacteriota bacterium]MCZ6876517.1 tRNA (N6-isopentenyl adenosine(37)-C2)-methylthiotransferase MiaB [Acidobacteriota bacterium]